MIDLLPMDENAFSRQGKQSEKPEYDLYVPAWHSVHTPPLIPLDPALQTQAVMTVLLVGDQELVGHKVQTVLSRYVLVRQKQSVTALEP